MLCALAAGEGPLSPSSLREVFIVVLIAPTLVTLTLFVNLVVLIVTALAMDFPAVTRLTTACSSPPLSADTGDKKG